MMKKVLYVLFIIATTYAIADVAESTIIVQSASMFPVIVNTNSTYIDRQAYIQDPYMGLPSKGGTQNVSESQIANQNIAEKWFSDGTWNVMSMAAYSTISGASNYGYGTNIFGQTGQVAGFSAGGLLTITNPINLGLSTSNLGRQAHFLPVNQVMIPSELFLEYQYSNVVQVDIGRIAINNSPWLSQPYYNNIITTGITYQGGLLNINPGGGWLLTALGFNQALPSGSTGFNNLTLYNSGFDYNTNTTNILNDPSNGTFAFGGTFSGLSNNYNIRLWGYHFTDYGNLAYADNSLKLIANENLNFNLAAQAGYEQGDGNSVFTHNGINNVSSTFYGLQAGLNYKWFGLSVGMNSIWGPNTSYLNGGIVSPYTYEIGTDPLYTSSYIGGLVEKAAGSAYKISPSFNFLDNNLTILPSYAYYSTVVVPSSSEYDLVITYNVMQIKGLAFSLDNAYMIQG